MIDDSFLHSSLLGLRVRHNVFQVLIQLGIASLSRIEMVHSRHGGVQGAIRSERGARSLRANDASYSTCTLTRIPKSLSTVPLSLWNAAQNVLRTSLKLHMQSMVVEPAGRLRSTSLDRQPPTSRSGAERESSRMQLSNRILSPTPLSGCLVHSCEAAPAKLGSGSTGPGREMHESESRLAVRHISACRDPGKFRHRDRAYDLLRQSAWDGGLCERGCDVG